VQPILETENRGEPQVLRREETQHLFKGASRAYATMAQILSFGQYLRWRDRLVEVATENAPSDPLILDVATGTGLISKALATQTSTPVIGIDLTRDMLEKARTPTKTKPDPPILHLLQADALQLPLPEDTFDILTMSYLLRYVDDPTETLQRLVRHVRPGGFFGFIEFYVPPNPLLRSLWRAHTRLVLPVGGALAGPGWWRVGRFLGGSIEGFWKTHDLDRLRQMMQTAGLTDIHLEPMSLGGGLVAWGRRGAP
jgi:demethylmenaquinone methyltransferase / 2-methoxy-6-polyprenyl-1,4-benzoquinol methylase